MSEIPWNDLTWPDIIGMTGIATAVAVYFAARFYPQVRAWWLLRREGYGK
jgi:hypothetical protein